MNLIIVLQVLIHQELNVKTTVDVIEVLWPRRGSLASRTELFPGPFAANTIVEITARCPGDLDASGTLGFADLLDLFTAWGPCENCVEDVDGDGVVGFGDTLHLLNEWGPCPG